MKTPYTIENQAFTNKAHMTARKCIYPRIFRNRHIEYQDTILGSGEAETILDGKFAIDRIIHVPTSDMKAKIKLTVQERFRKPIHASFRDISITEWNHASGSEGELYKLHANLFLYGYYDEENDTFIEAILINVPMLLARMATSTIKYSIHYMKDKQQDIINIGFDELKRTGCVMYASKNARP